MLLIDCPFCGGRAQTEFAYYGEAHLVRPEKPEALSDAEWADYVFLRTNPKGVHYERWMHIHGCRRFFNVMRDTVSGEIHSVYRIGERKPAKPAAATTINDNGATATVNKSEAVNDAASINGKTANDKTIGDNKAGDKSGEGAR